MQSYISTLSCLMGFSCRNKCKKKYQARYREQNLESFSLFNKYWVVRYCHICLQTQGLDPTSQQFALMFLQVGWLVGQSPKKVIHLKHQKSSTRYALTNRFSSIQIEITQGSQRAIKVKIPTQRNKQNNVEKNVCKYCNA